jgi:hypothetical protein
VNLLEAIPQLVGDLRRFDSLADRVEGLIESQVARYRPQTSDWLVIPWTSDFFLFSEDHEGQRRGREIVTAFLGPNVATLETVAEAELLETLPLLWKEVGLTRASRLRMVGSGMSRSEIMLSRLEDMASALSGRTRHVLEIKPTPSDLLRDFRLALLRHDDDAARHLFDEIRLNGTISAENLRYLRIEYLAAFERWAEMRRLPHLPALLQARRPRAVSETLLRMVRWTELVGAETLSVRAAFAANDVLGTFGALLRAVSVPTTSEGRLVGFLTALSDNDEDRQARILDAAAEAGEAELLQNLASADVVEPLQTTVTTETDPLVLAFEDGRFSEVIASFLAQPSVSFADLAVQAILESGDSGHASAVLQVVRRLVDDGEISLDRRARRDFEDLERLASDTCESWVEWTTRLAGDTNWPDANAVLRDSAATWQSLGELNSQQINDVCIALLGAAGGANDGQLRASLDVLCDTAARQLEQGSAIDFGRTVLMLLLEQDNFSEMVRASYLDLFEAWLNAGPPAAEYLDVLQQTATIWETLRSPNAVGWAIGVLESTADASCPDGAARTNFAIALIDDIRRQFYPKATIRERVEIEDIAAQLGLPSQSVESSAPERDLWSELDGKSVGIYSHLPRARILLESRLRRLCNVGEVEGNADEDDTRALRAMASRVDYLLVHTWKASHQATAAIDAVRPRERQIFPVQKGVTGFLRALESALSG